jgi:polyhydroxyalkanoate synthase
MSVPILAANPEEGLLGLPRLAEIARTCAEATQRASRILGGFIGKKVKEGMTLRVPRDELGIARAFAGMSARLLADPLHLAKNQMNMMWNCFSLWQHASLKMLGLSVPPPVEAVRGDKRFRDEEWEQHFLFDFMKQSYLMVARHLRDTICHVEGLDETARRKVDFFTRQYIDALSPSNFALTNPEVLRETIRTRGQNLIRGLNNLLADVEAGGGNLRIRMTDASAFELGGNIAVTPGKVVFQNDLMQLVHYAPAGDTQFRKPLLIVPPWINKYYILDLREKNSFVKWAVEAGHAVYLVSWVNPDARLAHKRFEDYLQEGALTAIDKVLADTGEKELNVIGYCLGGTLLMSALAVMAARDDQRVASAAFLATLIDFSEPGEIGVFLDRQTIAGLEARMNERGYLEGAEMAITFNLLRANDLIWSFMVNNYLMGKQPFPFDLLYWNSDSTRLPAAAHSFYLRNMYLGNRLKDPGGITLDGTPVDIGKVRTPSYFVSTLEDHIAPWKSVYKGARLPSGPMRFVVGGSGHIAGIVNPPSANKYGYWVNEARPLPEDAEDYLAGATQHAGSWWTDWQAWIGAHSGGEERVAARQPGKRLLKAIEDAPGGYVKLRLPG